MLLDKLLVDEQKINKELYSAGNYWNYKTTKIVNEIKKKGLSEFRSYKNGIGTSFTDSQVLDIRNELNLKGKIVSKIFSIPFVNRIFKEQLQVTKNHLDLHNKNKAIVFQNDKNVLNLLNKYKFENTTSFGCDTIFEYNNKDYSCHYLEMADRINKLSSSFNFNKIKSFFEIGGGFGSNIHFLITNFTNIKKILYLDIVPNIYIGTEYLKHFYKERVKDYSELKDLKKISFSNDNNLEILCIPPWLIEKVEVSIDHFHNSASFIEMPKKVIENYVKFIKKFKSNEISIISYLDFDSNTTFDPKEINFFFNNKLNIAYEDSVIKGYEKKLIHLFSSNKYILPKKQLNTQILD